MPRPTLRFVAAGLLLAACSDSIQPRIPNESARPADVVTLTSPSACTGVVPYASRHIYFDFGQDVLYDALDLNDRGEVAGIEEIERGSQAISRVPVLYSSTGVHNALANPTGYLEVSAVALNDSGDLAVVANTQIGHKGVSQGFLWRSRSGYVPITMPSGAVVYQRYVDTTASYERWPLALNNRQQVVGRYTLAGSQERVGFIWSPGAAARSIPIEPVDINDAGIVVGKRNLQSDLDPNIYLWSAARGTVIIGVPDHVRLASPVAITDDGAIAGIAMHIATGRPVSWIWRPGHGYQLVRILYPDAHTDTSLQLHPAYNGLVRDINHHEEVTGYVVTGYGHAFLYSLAGGFQVLPIPKETNIGIGDRVNGRGQVLGNYYVYTPDPGAAIRATADTMAALGRAGKVTPQQVASTATELEIIATMLDKGQHVSPTYAMNKFLDHVRGIMRNGRLTDGSGQRLIDRVQCIIDRVNTF